MNAQTFLGNTAALPSYSCFNFDQTHQSAQYRSRLTIALFDEKPVELLCLLFYCTSISSGCRISPALCVQAVLWPSTV
eukprot:3901695-Amphidinium_carterae.1